MKKMILIGALLEGGSLTTHAQTIGTMLQELIALEQLRKTTGTGYKEVVNDLQEIENIMTGDLFIHHAYFLSLNELNPVLLQKKEEIRTLEDIQIEILDEIYKALKYYQYLKDRITNKN